MSIDNKEPHEDSIPDESPFVIRQAIEVLNETNKFALARVLEDTGFEKDILGTLADIDLSNFSFMESPANDPRIV